MKPGAQYGPYTIQQPLGDGGFSQVYAAYDSQRRKVVALKVLDPVVTMTGEGRARFTREVEAARRLTHAHIVPVYNADIIDGRAFLAMRLMRGGTLAARLERTPILDAHTIARVVRHTARALDHGRRLGVIHRDVKPSNIFFSGDRDDRHICLGDFGLAKVRGLATVTQMGQVIGTIDYMAPEQVRGLRFMTPLSDVYSLGVVLYEMLTGRLPFEGQTQASVLRAIMNGAPARPSRHNPAISPEVERVVLQALHKDPQRRFATAGQLAAAYQKAAGRNGRINFVSRTSQPGLAVEVPPGRQAPAKRDPRARATTERPEFWVTILALVAFILLVLFTMSG